MEKIIGPVNNGKKNSTMCVGATKVEFGLLLYTVYEW